MVRVKVCGITNSRDALAATNLGADALGFVFYEKSPRCVTFETAGEIIRKLPPFVTKVGVFVNADLDFMKRGRKEAGFDVFQLHGDETPEFCSALDGNYIKAIRVKDKRSVAEAENYDTDALLFDSWSESEYGGSGRSFPWEFLERVGIREKRVILSGGLDRGNVARAAREVKPYAVDVSSGVESSPGVKDHLKLAEFIKEAKIG